MMSVKYLVYKIYYSPSPATRLNTARLGRVLFMLTTGSLNNTQDSASQRSNPDQ